ncbi:MAG: Trk system potassium transporter TrkA [Lachnospiraceae bacterium]|nr:Trk system potassium transporter TrkA [Lachnospiraceae bacterium]
MKIIIVGLGQTGKLLAAVASQEHHDVVVVDSRRDAVEEVTEKYNVNGVVGSGGSRKILIQAGAESADLLVALTPYDELNILSCMTAKKLGTRDTSARIRCPEFDEEEAYIMAEYGIDRLLNPEKEAAKEMLGHMELSGALRTEAFFDQKVIIAELEVEEGSPLAHMSVQQVKEFFDTDMLVVAVHRKEEIMIPDGNTHIQLGDRIEIIVPVKAVRDIFRRLHMKKKKQVQNILMVGCGTTGYYLAKELESSGSFVKILENDKERCIELLKLFPQAQVVCGDAVDTQTLKEEGIGRMDACLCLTGDDRTNLAVSLFARSEGVSRVIAKINEMSYEQLLKKTDINVCVSPSSVIVERLLSVIRNLASSDRSWIKKLYRIADGKAEAIAFEVSDSCGKIDIPFRSPDFKLRKGVLIASIIRGRDIIIPDGNSCMQAGDTVVIVTDADNIVKEIDDIFV